MSSTWRKYSGSLLSRPVLVLLGCLLSTAGHGAIVTLTIDATNSPISISGTLAGSTLQQQGAGSMNTKISGTIKADVTGSNITFVGGSAITLLNNGTWQPGLGGVTGSAPANFGVKVNILIFITVTAAVRNALLDVASSSLTVTGSAFPSSKLLFYYPTNSTTVLDYSAGSLGSGSESLTGILTNIMSTNSTIIVQGTQYVLTIPVDVSGTKSTAAGAVNYRLRGQLAARASVPVPLLINTFQLSSSQLSFTIATTPGQAYSILGSTNLSDWTIVHDQFTATNNPTTRHISKPVSPLNYFRIRLN